MVSVEKIYDTFLHHGVDFFTGVPDSLLKNICAYITDHAPRGKHIIAANEGSAVGIACGYYMASGNVPLVYMQNSGLGNTVKKRTENDRNSCIILSLSCHFISPRYKQATLNNTF